MRALAILGAWLGALAVLVGSFLFFGWLGQRFAVLMARFIDRSRDGS